MDKLYLVMYRRVLVAFVVAGMVAAAGAIGWHRGVVSTQDSMGKEMAAKAAQHAIQITDARAALAEQARGIERLKAEEKRLAIIAEAARSEARRYRGMAEQKSAELAALELPKEECDALRTLVDHHRGILAVAGGLPQ
jgi:hypothetical protein